MQIDSQGRLVHAKSEVMRLTEEDSPAEMALSTKYPTCSIGGEDVCGCVYMPNHFPTPGCQALFHPNHQSTPSLGEHCR